MKRQLFSLKSNTRAPPENSACTTGESPDGRASATIRLAAACLLTLHAGLLAWGAARHAPTDDEVAWLPAGVSHWTLGRFELARVNPPLPRMAAALPVLAAGVRTDWTRLSARPGSRAEFAVGTDFLRANGARAFWLFTVARWASIAFSLLAGWVCYRWGGELYGRGAGLMSAAVWCFAPAVLGNGHLVTADVPAAALGVAATYAFWRWLKRPTARASLGAGMLLGAAELSKTSLIVLYPVWFALWAARRWSGSLRETAPPGGWGAVLILLVSLYVLNLGYGFEGSFARLGRLQFVSVALAGEQQAGGWANRFERTWLAEVPLPLPANYVLGIDQTKAEFERGKACYLRGQWQHGGWWYYYLYALAVKVPLGTWLLATLALGATVVASGYRAKWQDELALLLPPAAILLLASSQTGFSTLRYLLPAAPFAFIWLGKLARAVHLKHRALAGAGLLALSWSMASSLAVYPHSLAYFNELAGGPLNGHAHLVDSNMDWGQDLLYLKRWIEQHPETRPLYLAYFGLVDPRVAGMEFKPPARAPTAAGEEGRLSVSVAVPQPGWHAVSVNVLRGLPTRIADGQGDRQPTATGDYSYFAQLKPVARAGYTIYIYDVKSSTPR